MTEISEKIYYHDAGVVVSDKRFVSEGTTYALHNIASVAAGTHAPRKLGWILALILGLVVIPANPFFGIPIAALAAWSLYQRRKAYVVVLRDASGETNALSSRDRATIEKIVAALNLAIVERA